MSDETTVQLTTGNDAMDNFLQSMLSFMTNMASRMDDLVEILSALTQTRIAAGEGAFCNCMGNEVDVNH